MIGRDGQSPSNIELLLTKLVDELSRANEKLDLLVELNSKSLMLREGAKKPFNNGDRQKAEVKLTPDVMSLLAIPLSLRKTLMVLYKLEKATANDLAKETMRLRAVESASANQLVRMGYLGKKREGRDVYFYIETPMEINR